jgi:competence protein ComEA
MNSRFISKMWIWLVALSLLTPAGLLGSIPSPSGESSAAPSSKQSKSKKKKKSSAEASDQSAEKNASGKKASKIDVNTASKEDLDALPGIGDAYAQKIIEGRPYKSKSDLVRKGVLPASEYDKVKDQITARQSSPEQVECG